MLQVLIIAIAFGLPIAFSLGSSSSSSNFVATTRLIRIQRGPHSSNLNKNYNERLKSKIRMQAVESAKALKIAPKIIIAGAPAAGKVNKCFHALYN